MGGADESRSNLRGRSGKKRHFLSRLMFSTRAKEEESFWRIPSGGTLPSSSWLCGGVTFWLRHQFPLPFPTCLSSYPSWEHPPRVAREALRCLGGPSPIPWFLRSPSSLLFPSVGPGVSLMEILVLSHPFLPALSLHTPSLSWTSQTLSWTWVMWGQGHGIWARQAGCSSSTLAPRTTPPTVLTNCSIPHWRQGRRSQDLAPQCAGFLYSGPITPCSCQITSLLRLLRIFALLCHSQQWGPGDPEKGNLQYKLDVIFLSLFIHFSNMSPILPQLPLVFLERLWESPNV